MPKLGRKNWQPSFLSTTFLYRNCCKIFGPVEPQFSSRSSPSPKLGRKNMKKLAAQFFEHNLPLQELLQKFWSSWTAVFFAQLSLTQTWTERLAAQFFKHTFSLTGTAWEKFFVQFSQSQVFLGQSSSPKLGRKNWQPSSSRTAFLYGNCVKFFWSNSVPSFFWRSTPSQNLGRKIFYRSFLHTQLPHWNLGGKFGPGQFFPRKPFFFYRSCRKQFGAVQPKFLTQHPLIQKLGGKDWQPSSSCTTFSYRNCWEIFGPVEPQFSLRSSPSPKLGRKDWQPSSLGDNFPFTGIASKIIGPTQRNLDRKIWPSPVLWAQLHWKRPVQPQFWLLIWLLTWAWLLIWLFVWFWLLMDSPLTLGLAFDLTFGSGLDFDLTLVCLWLRVCLLI